MMLTCVIVVCVYVRITWATCLTFALGASDMAVTCHFLAMLSKEKIRRCCEANKLGWTRPTFGHATWAHNPRFHASGPTRHLRGAQTGCVLRTDSCSKLHPKAMSCSVVCSAIPRDTCTNAWSWQDFSCNCANPAVYIVL